MKRATPRRTSKSTRAAWADAAPPDALRLVVIARRDVAGSSVPVVPAVASVCRAWRDAAHARPSARARHGADFSGDGDPSDAVIARYCRDGHWRALEHLDLRDCPISDKALDALFVDDARRGAPALSSLFARTSTTTVKGQQRCRKNRQERQEASPSTVWFDRWNARRSVRYRRD